MSSGDISSESEGSWTPFLVITFLLILRWIVFGQADVPVRIRRWCNMKKIHWKKTRGYRDETKYQMTAGDGANQKYKRQG
mmetsp:Transcript_10491/g.16075  ORF Transcript_10491/g.16075 Transcript_10491/m.16075 type:complete len:80 (-) Transcript_10491:1551-1790(-)